MERRESPRNEGSPVKPMERRKRDLIDASEYKVEIPAKPASEKSSESTTSAGQTISPKRQKTTEERESPGSNDVGNFAPQPERRRKLSLSFVPPMTLTHPGCIPNSHEGNPFLRAKFAKEHALNAKTILPFQSVKPKVLDACSMRDI